MKHTATTSWLASSILVALTGGLNACSSDIVKTMAAGGSSTTGGWLAMGGAPEIGEATGSAGTMSIGGALSDSGPSDDSGLSRGNAGSGPSGKYVALGSSFAAGPKIPDSVPGQSCGRSTNNYAHLIAADLGLDLTDVSCIGAIIDNIALAPQQSNPLQIEAITPDAQIVTITIGGNDVRYSASLVTCGKDGANGASCLGSDAGADVDAAAIDELLKTEQQVLVTMLKSVKQAAPGARIFLLAYPMILPDPPVPCPPSAPFEPADATFLGTLGKKLQDSFVGAAQEASVQFIDVYSASQGHDVCAADGQRWVEGQTLPAAQPYHPNAIAMRAQADLIEAEIRRAL
jgi:hypothetical protein